jgi:FKBP-type peptidyl-prolyl cis-trans isomerase SlyD
MAVKEGDFIRLEYTGKVQETGNVFDTTDESVAEEAGIKLDSKTYGAIPIIVGGGHVLKGLDEALIGMEEGEEKTVEITPEEGFGLRDPKLLQLIPMGEFKKQGMKPEVGMAITSDGVTGIIRSVSGGRVRVDFNHELAGKNLIYNIKVVKEIEDDIDKVKSMIELHYSAPNLDSEKHDIKIVDGVVRIAMDEMAKFDKKPYMDVTFARFRIARDIWENMENIEKVEFVDVFEKKVEEEAEEAEAAEIAEEVIAEEAVEEAVEEVEIEEIAEEVLKEVDKKE